MYQINTMLHSSKKKMWKLSSSIYAVQKLQLKLIGLGGKLACEWWAITCKQWATKYPTRGCFKYKQDAI